VERTLGKHPAKEIWKPEGGIKCVRNRPRAQRPRNQRFAHEAENAAGHRRASNAGKLSDKAHEQEAPRSVLVFVILPYAAAGFGLALPFPFLRPFSSTASNSLATLSSRSGFSIFAPVRSVT